MHFVNGGGVGVGVKEGVHMGAYMINHAEECGGEGEPVIGRAELKIFYGFFVRVMRNDNRALEQLMCRHVVGQL